MRDADPQSNQAATPQPAARDSAAANSIVVSRNSSTDALPSEAAPNHISIEALGKSVAQLAVVAYAIGLFAVNSYLFGMGVSDFELFRARFVTTGFLIISVVTFAVAGPWYAWDSLYDMRAQDASFLDRLKGFGNFLMGLGLPWLAFSLLMLIFEADSPWLSGLRLYALSAVVGYILVLSLFLVRKTRQPNDSVHGLLIISKSSDHLARVKGRGTLKRFFSGPAKSSRPPSLSGLFGVSIFFLAYAFLFLSFFVGKVYPQIPEQFGGGKPREAVLLISKDAEDTLTGHGLIPKPSSSKTSQDSAQKSTSIRLCILHQGNDYYVVRVIEDGRTFQLSKDDVIGAYLDPRSSLARKCID